jgi:hypothetical protein
MTTSITIVNHGPNPVKVNPSGSIVYSHQSRHEYVYEDGNVTVEEVLPVRDSQKANG